MWTVEYEATNDTFLIRGPRGIVCNIDSLVDRLYGDIVDLIRTAPEMLEVLKDIHKGYGKAHSKSAEREKIARIIALAEGRDYEPEKPPCKS